MLLIATGVNFIDVAGAELLAQVARELRDAGGDLYLCGLKPQVHDVLERGDTLAALGRDHVFETKEEAVKAIYARLASERCAACTVRSFRECAAVLPDGTARIRPRPDFSLTPPP